MLFIIGTRSFHYWHAVISLGLGSHARCADVWQLRVQRQFVRKKAIRTLALFFVIPVLPLGKIRHLRQCPNCRTRYPL